MKHILLILLALFQISASIVTCQATSMSGGPLVTVTGGQSTNTMAYYWITLSGTLAGSGSVSSLSSAWRAGGTWDYPMYQMYWSGTNLMWCGKVNSTNDSITFNFIPYGGCGSATINNVASGPTVTASNTFVGGTMIRLWSRASNASADGRVNIQIGNLMETPGYYQNSTDYGYFPQNEIYLRGTNVLWAGVASTNTAISFNYMATAGGSTSTGSTTNSISHLPSTNVVGGNDDLILNVSQGGGSYTTRRIAASYLTNLFQPANTNLNQWSLIGTNGVFPTNDNKFIVLEGSSTMAGQAASSGASSVAGQMTAALNAQGWTVSNIAVGAQYTSDCINRIYSQIVKMPVKPRAVIFAQGVNDLNVGFDYWTSNQMKYSDLLDKLGVKTIYVTQWPSSIPGGEWANTQKQVYNAMLERSGFPLFDWHSANDNRLGTNQLISSVNSDDTHANNAGHTNYYKSMNLSLLNHLERREAIKVRQGGFSHGTTSYDPANPTNNIITYDPGVGACPNFTMSAWIRIKVANTSNQRIMAVSRTDTAYNSGTELRLFYQGDGKLGLWSGVNMTDISLGTFTPSDLKWHQYTLVHNETIPTTILYIDGIEMARTDLDIWSGAGRTGSFKFSYVGSNPYGLNNCEYQDLAFWRVPLLPDAVKQLYNGQVPRAGLEVFSPLTETSVYSGQSLVNLAPIDANMKVVNFQYITPLIPSVDAKFTQVKSGSLDVTNTATVGALTAGSLGVTNTASVKDLVVSNSMTGSAAGLTNYPVPYLSSYAAGTAYTLTSTMQQMTFGTTTPTLTLTAGTWLLDCGAVLSSGNALANPNVLATIKIRNTTATNDVASTAMSTIGDGGNISVGQHFRIAPTVLTVTTNTVLQLWGGTASPSPTAETITEAYMFALKIGN